MNIEAHFDIRRGEFRLAIDLALPGSGVSSIFGPSGCGKTSLLRAIAGLDRYPGGHLRVGDLLWQAERTFVPPHRRALGYVFQEPSLFEHLDVRGNLHYGQRRVHPRERRTPLDRAIELLGIGPLLARRPQTLSGGEMQRVAIARALAASPRLLLLDEPMAALDLARRQEVLPYLESLHQELDIPIIHVSHATDEVARLADHLVLLDGAGVVGSGPLASMLTRFDLPLAHGADAAALVEAVVTAHDEHYHLTYLQSGESQFTVLHRDLPPGTQVRLRIAARDVSLARSAHSGSSILNILPMTVTDLASEDAAQVTVGLESGGGVRLLARVTRKSVAALDIRPGQRIWAQVKGIALLA